MYSRAWAFRGALAGLAAACAALFAHAAIDWLGDFLLSHDAYDNVPHDSRAVCFVIVAIAVLAGATRLIFDMIDRRCGSRRSLLCALRAALGSPATFVMQTTVAAVVLLAGMEFSDCAAAHVRVDGVEDLFGGSLILGLTTVTFSATIAGLLLHRLVRFLSECEPALTAFVVRLIVRRIEIAAPLRTKRRIRSWKKTSCGLVFARAGRKRGPPLLIPG